MRKDKDLFIIFERRILWCVCGPIKECGMWRARFYHELFPVNNEREINYGGQSRKVEVVWTTL